MSDNTDDTNYADTNPIEYEQGQRARLSSIHEQDCPHDADTAPGKAWKAGYDAAEAAAARDRTSGPVELQDNDAGDDASSDAGTDQLSTATKPAKK